MSHANRFRLWLATAAVAAAGGLAIGGTALAAPASASTTAASSDHATAYRFTILDNADDLTFNQLLGINNDGLIAGYFGSGAQGHPNKGYLLRPPYGQGKYINENFPGSVQTQVTGLNNRGVTVGFWSSTNNGIGLDANFGFVDVHGRFLNANFPTATLAPLTVDQLLGVNDRDIAVGFYVDATGTSHGYEYSIRDHRFSLVVDPSAPTASLTAAAINDHGDVAGVYTSPASGVTDGFLLAGHGHFTDLAVPGAASTMALGVNDHDEVVGVYMDAAGNLHGFTWTREHGFSTVDDPQGQGTTTINGINDKGDLVGFFVDATGNTDGFLATPLHH
jgi:hypothetical protein